MTTIYLIRHSIRLGNNKILKRNTNDSIQQIAEKDILSVEGEERAKRLSMLEELDNIDKVYASNCPRTLQTAKYLLDEQQLLVTIDDRLDERRVGIPNSDTYPNWFELQYLDFNFKTVGGESQKEVRERVEECINEILDENKNKRIAVFTHGYAITFYLLKWLKLVNVTNDQKLTLEYNGKIFFDRVIDAPEIFKLEFDENKNLINLENIIINY